MRQMTFLARNLASAWVEQFCNSPAATVRTLASSRSSCSQALRDSLTMGTAPGGRRRNLSHYYPMGVTFQHYNPMRVTLQQNRAMASERHVADDLFDCQGGISNGGEQSNWKDGEEEQLKGGGSGTSGRRGRRRAPAVYAVAVGRQTGVFHSWEEAERAVRGFSGAVYMKFSNKGRARAFVQSQARRSTGGSEAAGPSANDSPVLKLLPPPEPLGPFYAVARGPKEGIYMSWPEAQAAAKGVSGVVYKRFNSRTEAEGFLDLNRVTPGATLAGSSPAASPSGTTKRPRGRPRKNQPPLDPSLAAQPGRAAADTASPPSGAAASASAESDPCSLGTAPSSPSPTPVAPCQPEHAAPSAASSAATSAVPAERKDTSAGCVSSPRDHHLSSSEVGKRAKVWDVPDAVAEESCTEGHTGIVAGSCGPPGALVPDLPPNDLTPQSNTYYAVAHGKQVGVFTSWADTCRAVGGVSGARHRKFRKLSEANDYLAGATSETGTSPEQAAEALTSTPTSTLNDHYLMNAVALGVEQHNGVGDSAGRSCRTMVEKVLHKISCVGEDTSAHTTSEFQNQGQCSRTALASHRVSAGVPVLDADVYGDDTWPLKGKEEDDDEEMGRHVLAIDGGLFDEQDESELLNFNCLSGMADPGCTYRLEFDGGSRHNPGNAGFGAVLVDVASGLHVEYVAGPLASSSNNVAEWTALVAGMQVAADMGVRHLVVQGDSELVCRQVSGRYSVNNSALQPLAARVRRLRASLESFEVRHVPRAANATADLLSNLAMDAEEVVAEVEAEMVEEVEAEMVEDIYLSSPDPVPASLGRGRTTHRAGRRQLRQQLGGILQELGQPALQAARAAMAAAAAESGPLAQCTSGEVVGLAATAAAPGPAPGMDSAGARRGYSVVERKMQAAVTECAPPLATRGSVAGSVEEFRRTLIALACAVHGLLE